MTNKMTLLIIFLFVSCLPEFYPRKEEDIVDQYLLNQLNKDSPNSFLNITSHEGDYNYLNRTLTVYTNKVHHSISGTCSNDLSILTTSNTLGATLILSYCLESRWSLNSFTLTTDGPYDIVFTGYYAVNGETIISSMRLILDRTPPYFSLDNDPTVINNIKTKIFGTCDPEIEIMKVTRDKGLNPPTFACDRSTGRLIFDFNSDLAKGTTEFEIFMIDRSGNIGRQYFSIYYDPDPPQISFKLPFELSSSDSNVSNTFSTTAVNDYYYGTCDYDINSIVLQLNGRFIALDNQCQTNGYWRSLAPVEYFPESSNTLTLKAIDTSSNKSELTMIVNHSNAANLKVESYYDNAPNWNDYVNTTSGNLCDGTETSLNICTNGGEKRLVTTDYTTCDGLKMRDNLEAFDWHCEVSNNQARFYSTLKDTKGIKDLVDYSNLVWALNGVSLQKTGLGHIQISDNSSWWTNPIYELPDNSLSTATTNLNVQSAFYVLDRRRETRGGYNIGADKVGFIIGDNGKIQADSTFPNNCSNSSGEIDSLETCILSAGNQNFLWIEGQFEDPNSSPKSKYGALFYNIKFSKIWYLAANNFSYGLLIKNSNYNTLNNLKMSSNTSYGIALENSTNNYFKNIVTANNTLYGFQLSSSSSNLFKQLRTFNNGNIGLYLSNNSNTNIMTQLLAHSNNADGIKIDSSSDNKILLGTLFNNLGDGLNISNNSDQSFVQNIVTLNNFSDGIELNNSDNGIFAHLVSVSHPVGYDINIDNASYNEFIGNMIIDKNDCFIANSPTDPGLYVTPNSDCFPGYRSVIPPAKSTRVAFSDLVTALATATVSLDYTFLGKITLNDQENRSDVAGTASYDNITDWTNFENDFRAWVKEDNETFPHPNFIGRCTTGNNCRIFDLQLSSSDNILLNKTGDGINQNTTFTEYNSCPSEVNGDQFLQNFTSTLTFFKNAIEIIDDNIGDNDGLCEQFESCLYIPNFGAYQGSGDLGSCTFNSSGGYSDISIYGYSKNGE